MFHRVLVTATPLSARVDSDVVEEEDLNCAKRSGRVRPPNLRGYCVHYSILYCNILYNIVYLVTVFNSCRIPPTPLSSAL